MRSLLFAAAAAAAGCKVASATYNATDATQHVYLAGTAYCSQGSIESWSCGACRHIPGVTGATFMTNSSADGFADVYAYSIVLPSKAIVVAFRGTTSSDIRDWLLDFDFIPMNPMFGECPGCEVHEGFYRGWEALSGQVMAAVEKYGGKNAPAIYVTGHSLGAAMANLATFDLASNGYPIGSALYNFGQPRVGNPAYAAAYDAVVTNATGTSSSSSSTAKRLRGTDNDNAGTHSYRVVHHQDPVPQLPPQAFGFAHSPAEVWYNEDASSYQVCSLATGEDPTCSDSQIDLNFEDHSIYLGLHVSGMC